MHLASMDGHQISPKNQFWLQMKQRALVEEIKSQKKQLHEDMMLIKRFKLDRKVFNKVVGNPPRAAMRLQPLPHQPITPSPALVGRGPFVASA